MQLCRSTVCCFAIVVVVGLVLNSVAAKDASTDQLNRLRRSVNFTPSWGKRSGVVDAANANRLNFVRQAGSRSGEGCLSKGVYIEMMIDNLKAEMESYGECVRDAFVDQ